MPYLNVIEVEAALLVATDSPFDSFTELITLPNSTREGRPCHAVKIPKNSDSDRPGVYFLGGVHAREWGSPDILINFLEQIEQAYLNNTSLTFGAQTFSAADIKRIIDTLDIFVFPQANPDGRNYSMNTDAVWRKNRRTAPPNSAACPGVDINRNFDFLWNFLRYFAQNTGIRSSIDPCDPESYIGDAAFSEPETRNIAYLLDSYPNIGYFVDLHSFGETILYSWGDDQSQTRRPKMNFRNRAFNGQRGLLNDIYREYIPRDDLAAAQSLAAAMEAAIAAYRGRAYEVKSAYDLYGAPTSGASDDYAYSRHFVDPTKNKVISYTVEWGSRTYADPMISKFHPPYSEMQDIIQEITCGLIAFCLAVCEREDAMAWRLTGNTAIDPNTNYIGTTDAEPVVVRTNGAEKLRITDAGNVGIGTAAPSAGLEIEKGATNNLALRLSSSGPGWGSGLQLRNTSPGEKTFGIYSGLGGRLHFADVDNSVDRLVITKDGNCGIGTDQPSARLSLVAAGAVELQGTARSATLLTSAGTLGTAAGSELALATVGFRTGNNSSLGIRALRVAGGGGWDSTAIGLGMDVDNTVRAGASLWLQANGCVSIGTSDPPANVSGGILFAVKGMTPDEFYTAYIGNTGTGGALTGYSKSSGPSILGLSEGPPINSNQGGAGVQGHALAATTSSAGVIGSVGQSLPYSPTFANGGGAGVFGHSPGGSGVVGLSEGTGSGQGSFYGNGVEGQTNGNGSGVYARAMQASAYALYAENSQGTAGVFQGDVNIQGTLTASGKGFKIDHPLDPSKKYLAHSSVESPDMMNVYAGNIVTDNDGKASAALPDYFEALNRDFKYQLTVIGELAQAVVEREIEDGHFLIRTNRPNTKVSWQVMGTRKDPYAEAHRIRVEEEKSDTERGRYLHPEFYETESGAKRVRPIGWMPGTCPQELERRSTKVRAIH